MPNLICNIAFPTSYSLLATPVLSLLLILATVAAAPNDPGAVSAGDVLNCDFEERTDCDYDAWPDGWTRQRSRELPEFLKIGIVQEPATNTSQAASADGKPSIAAKAPVNNCLEIVLNGGGAVVASPPQPVSTQFSLSLTARIKTSELKHDGAWVELSLIDDEGHVLQHRVHPAADQLSELDHR